MEGRIKIFGLLVVLGSFFWLYFANSSFAQNVCSGDKPLPCSERYLAPCTTASGQPGVQICYKFGCSPDGRGGPACTWGPGSYCEPCRVPGQPTPTPAPNCQLTDPSMASVGYCTLEGLQQGDLGQGLGAGQCQAVCSADWSYPPDYPGVVECREVVCSCGNARTCCRIEEQPTPGQPTETPPVQNTPTPTPPPPTPPPVISNVPTPTPKPTIVYLTPTPTPEGGGRPDFQNKNQTWVCLKSEFYKKYQLKVSGLLPAKVQELYIVGCIETEDDILCTTGNDQEDRRLRLNKYPQHNFKLIQPESNPFKLGASEVEAIVYSYTPDQLVHQFYAVFENDQASIEGEGRSPQLGTFPFSEGDQSECVIIRWDPRGRVLEKEGLKPVEGVKITLLDLKGKKVKQPGLQNPLFTDKNGGFDFMVQEGRYYIEIEVPEGYSLIGDRRREVIAGKERKEVIILVKREKNPKTWIFELLNSFKLLWKKL